MKRIGHPTALPRVWAFRRLTQSVPQLYRIAGSLCLRALCRSAAETDPAGPIFPDRVESQPGSGIMDPGDVMILDLHAQVFDCNRRFYEAFQRADRDDVWKMIHHHASATPGAPDPGPPPISGGAA